MGLRIKTYFDPCKTQDSGRLTSWLASWPAVKCGMGQTTVVVDHVQSIFTVFLIN